MKKFILTHDGKEVKIGDILTKQSTVDCLLGKTSVIQEIIVSEYSIPNLIALGIIKPIEEEPCKECTENIISMDIDDYVYKIAERLGIPYETVNESLTTLYTIYPAAVFSTILKEIALEIDLKYEDHIQNSPKIYIISTFNGRIIEADKAHIKNYKNFAAFRSIEDAKTACKITKNILKKMFKSEKQ